MDRTQEVTSCDVKYMNDCTFLCQIFLVVANSREAQPELSVIYRWNQRRKRFLRYQTLETHAALDWEAFSIHNQSFLVVANHRRGKQQTESLFGGAFCFFTQNRHKKSLKDAFTGFI